MVHTVFVPLLLSLVVGLLRGGRLNRLAAVELKGIWLVFLLFTAQVVLHLMVRFEVALPRMVGAAAFSLTYVGMFAILVANARLPGIKLAAAGVLMNAIVIIANGGRMPVRPEALVKPEQLEFLAWLASGSSPSHQVMTADTRLWFLGDVLHFPPHWRFHSVFSVGDVLLTLGLFILIQQVMVSREASAVPNGLPGS